MNASILAALGAFLTLNAFAQVKPPAKTGTTQPSPKKQTSPVTRQKTASSTPNSSQPPAPAWTIESKRSQAESDLKAAQAAIEKLAGQTGQEWLCQSQQWKMRQAYAQWFLDHSSEFTQADAAIQSMKLEVREKVAKLQSEGITPIAVEGQASAPVQVALPELTAYLNLLNSRVKSCTPGLVESLIREHDDPRTNSIQIGGRDVHLSHTQVIELLERMTTNLNGSLKESKHQYFVELQRGACGFDLVLRVQVQVGDGSSQELTWSLLDPKSEPRPTTPSRISKEYASGLGRYLEMHNSMIRDAACLLPDWAAINPARVAYDSDPYVSFEQASAAFRQQSANAPQADLSEQAELLRRYGVELRPTQYCQSRNGSQLGYRAGQVIVDGLPLTHNECFQSVFVVPNGSKIGLFARGEYYLYYTDFGPEANRPAGSNAKAWSWRSITVDSFAHLLAARLVDGVPAVAYLTFKGEVRTANINGTQVPLARFALSSTVRTKAPRLDLTSSKACDEQSRQRSYDVYQLTLDGENLGSYSCVVDAQAIPFYDTTLIVAIDTDRKLRARYADSGWTLVSQTLTSLIQIRSIEVQNGIPVITVLTYKGEIKRVNLKGNDVVN